MKKSIVILASLVLFAGVSFAQDATKKTDDGKKTEKKDAKKGDKKEMKKDDKKADAKPATDKK